MLLQQDNNKTTARQQDKKTTESEFGQTEDGLVKSAQPQERNIFR